MKSKYYYLLFIIVQSLPFSGLNAQILEYDILVFIPIGKLEIERYANENNLVTIEMNSKVKILFTELQLFSEVNINNGKIQSSTFRQQVNKNVKIYTEGVQKSDKSWYSNFIDGTAIKISNEPKISVSELYFEEPMLVDSVFSERFGQSCYLEKIDLYTVKKIIKTIRMDL